MDSAGFRAKEKTNRLTQVAEVEGLSVESLSTPIALPLSPPSPVQITNDYLKDTVVLIYNLDSHKSLEIAEYYESQRGAESGRENKFSNVTLRGYHFGACAYSGDVVTSAVGSPSRATLDTNMGSDLLTFLGSLAEMPGYIIFSKDCPLYHTNVSGGTPYPDTPETVEVYLFFKILDELGSLTSVTRLEGRSVQDVKDIIDRSVASDSYDMSQTKFCINDVGGHVGASRLDRAVILARETSIASQSIALALADSPRTTDIPITKNTIFYADLSGMYLNYGGQNRSAVYYHQPTSCDMNENGKLVDSLPATWSVLIDWCWDSIFVQLHTGSSIPGKVRVSGAFSSIGSTFTVLDAPALDYQVGDEIQLKATTSKNGEAYPYSIRGTVLSVAGSSITLHLVSKTNPQRENCVELATDTPLDMLHGVRILVGTDIAFSEDYSAQQSVEWVSGKRPTRPFWFKCDHAASNILHKYEQIEYAPGGFTFQMNSACGVSNGLTNKSKYSRDTCYTFYSQMNRPNGATLAIGSPFEPYECGLGDCSVILMLVGMGVNFGLASIFGALCNLDLTTLYANRREAVHVNVIGDPLCAPLSRVPALSFKEIVRLYMEKGWGKREDSFAWTAIGQQDFESLIHERSV